MELKSYLFALNRKSNDLHTQVFKAIELTGTKDFLLDNVDRKPILFYSTKRHIIARTNQDVEKLPTKEYVLNVEVDEVVKGLVTLARDWPRMVINKEEEQQFILENNRKPKYSESHKFEKMSDEKMTEYAINQLKKAGLEVFGEVGIENVGARLVKKGKKKLTAVDIAFTAKIVDLEALKNAWFKGIGRNKTYGFGMLRIAKYENQ